MLPAPEDVAAIELAVEVDETELRVFQDAADTSELFVAFGDPARDGLDLALQLELLGGFAPLGIGAGGEELMAVHEIAPLRIQRRDVRNDAADERQSALGFGDGEIPGHDARR